MRWNVADARTRPIIQSNKFLMKVFMRFTPNASPLLPKHKNGETFSIIDDIHFRFKEPVMYVLNSNMLLWQ